MNLKKRWLTSVYSNVLHAQQQRKYLKENTLQWLTTFTKAQQQNNVLFISKVIHTLCLDVMACANDVLCHNLKAWNIYNVFFSSTIISLILFLQQQSIMEI